MEGQLCAPVQTQKSWTGVQTDTGTRVLVAATEGTTRAQQRMYG